MDRIIIVDCRADNETIKELQKTGSTVITTVKLDCLYDAVASHADMQIHYLGDDRFVCAPETYSHYKKLLPHGFTLIKGSARLSSKYPDDIAYNAAALKDCVICKSRCTATEILETYGSKGTDILNAAQGYTKCSTCVVNGHAIITADSSIASAAEKHNVDVLGIREGHIELRGMNYGFIGGASGLIERNVLAFNGELSTHSDGDNIRSFCKNHGTEVVELKKGILTDIGSIITNIDL